MAGPLLNPARYPVTSHSPRTAPPALTSVFISPEGITFTTSADQELTLPRPVWTQVGCV